MAKRLIICAAEARSQANRILGHLINGGFDERSISILFAEKKESGNAPSKKGRGISMMAKAGVGALLGGAFVWLGGTGVLTVPKLGSLVIAGSPLAAAMGRLNRGGVAQALENMGLSKNDAGFYEARVEDGNILISISVADHREALAARHIVRAIGVHSISDTGAAESAC